ncbi:MAG: pirin family protein [Bacteroidales bacterium]|nr:pirin family protein [Bacteroidales bacterium]
MKTIIDKAASRGHANYGWLDTYYTFSFADYFNPEKIHFGALRVLNDDTIAPQKGFGMHQHKNMEVITIPLKGFVRHGDSMENSDFITRGDIQVMSTGTGIYHSEHNDSRTEPLEMLQIWVLPKKENTEPAYQNYDIRNILKKNQFSLIVSPDHDAPASILQDAWFSLGEFDAGKTIEYSMHKKNNMGAYLFIIEGKIKIGETVLSRRDGIGIYDTKDFVIETLEKSELLLMEVPML